MDISRDARQNEGIDKWVKNRCIGSFIYCTGFGKTYTAIKAIKRFLAKNPNAVVLVVVPTDYLRDQWQTQLIVHALILNTSVKVINSVIKKDWEVDFLVIDEVHRAAAQGLFAVFTKVKYKILLCLTGTMERLDGRDQLIRQKAPIVDYVGIDEAIENKWLAPYKEYKVLLDVDLTEYREINKKFDEHFSYFNFNFNVAMACATKVTARRSYAKFLGTHENAVYVKALVWNKLMRARKAFIQNHEHKLEIASKILEYRPNAKAITFSSTKAQAEKLPGLVLHSGKTKKKRAITMEDFNVLEKGILNTAKSLDEGADIPGLNLAIILGGTSSSIQLQQRIGRVIRYSPDKEAEIFNLIIKGTVEEEWFRRSHGEKPFITIYEDQLESLLKGEQIATRDIEEISMTYRF